jgi:alpha/beta superfamily hydrolase
VTQLTTRHLEFPCGDLTLEGELRFPSETPAPGVVVCHPHPLYGGDMDNSVVVAACDALVARGFAALRFNFRGVGASEGAFSKGDAERNDVRAALDHLAAQDEVDAGRVGLTGYSFGAIVSADTDHGGVRALALISPPLSIADLRVHWDCPAIVLGGEEDQIAPPDRLRIVASAPGVELCLIEGADHFWHGYEQELGDAVADFFGRHFA